MPPDCDVPFAVAVTDTLVSAATADVVTANVADDCPAATVTDAGTVTEALPLTSAITRPPVGAGPFVVTVPTAAFPPIRLVGLMVTDTGVVRTTDTVAVLLMAAAVAVIVAETSETTAVVVTLKLAVVAPAGTTTLAGTVTPARFDDSVTVTPPVPAADARLIVPVATDPPTIVVGSTVTETRSGRIVRVFWVS